MKKFNTLLCCALLTAYGAFVGINNTGMTQEVNAATVNPIFDYDRIPMDLRPVREVEKVVHDTITVEVPKVVTKYKVKEVKVPYRDTVNVVIHFEFNESSHIKQESVEPDTMPNV